MTKERWHNEDAAFGNPFSVLKKSERHDVAEPDEPKRESPIRLPKVKSSRLERAQHGGKTVTVVAFHGTPGDEAKAAWLKAMKKELGVGGAIEDGVVMLQGDQRDRL